MRFSTRLLLVQLATVVSVVLVCAVFFLLLAVQQLRAESESSALNIARTVAVGPEVRELVAAFSEDPGTPDAAQLRDGVLQALAGDISARTDALFVVITDDHGIRLAHPNPDLLGQVVSTPFADVLAGKEVVDWERGTLGESARAKVPIYPVAGLRPVGEVSVGFETASVFDDLPAVLAAVGLAALGAVGLAALASVLMRRRWERVTLGLQPEELTALVQNQAAVLDGVDDGVIARDTDGVIRVCNATAQRLLGARDPVGRTLAEAGVPAEAVARIDASAATLVASDVSRATGGDAGSDADGILIDGHLVYLDVRAVRRDGRDLGDIILVRDRTDLIALTERLETVRAMTNALRVQRHEFANRMHVAAGLIDAERVTDAREFLSDLVERGSVDFPVENLDLVSDPFLQAFLGAKALETGERGVRLGVGDDTQLFGAIRREEDVAAVLGNLIDNAVDAAVHAPAPRWVHVSLLDDGDALVVTVADSGDGIAPGTDVFARRSSDGEDDAVHGHGIGLTLSREIARHRGGDVWVIDPGGPDGDGAVFGARLPDSVGGAGG
ncbi:sensor histidine kinase [Microbacterium sp. 1P10UB]|uniref:sensor histidine kinase n=1 Tax=unclassified Microbacterium TaxID=2609290 RepID=UPI0039A3A3AF